MPTFQPFRSMPPPRPLREARRTHLSRPLTPLVLAVVLVTLLPAAPTGLAAQHPQDDGSPSIRVSLRERHLWLVVDGDTLLDAAVAVGRSDRFRYRGRVYEWETPTGTRPILAKRRNPVWNVPQWHYYERASSEGLDLVEMARSGRYELPDGSWLEVRGADVVRTKDGQYWTVPRGRELIIDGVLYVPPHGTRQRQVPGALGSRALDLGDGVLIHGTHRYSESSIGSAASHGCIRMANEDVERLFDLVEVGTQVRIY